MRLEISWGFPAQVQILQLTSFLKSERFYDNDERENISTIRIITLRRLKFELPHPPTMLTFCCGMMSKHCYWCLRHYRSTKVVTGASVRGARKDSDFKKEVVGRSCSSWWWGMHSWSKRESSPCLNAGKILLRKSRESIT